MQKRESEQFSAAHMLLARKCVNDVVRAYGAGFEGSGIEIDDLMQEAFFSMRRAYAGYDEKHRSSAKLETYLYACVRNGTSNELRRISGRKRREKEIMSGFALYEKACCMQEPEMSGPLLDCLIADIAAKAAPRVRYADRKSLEEFLRALCVYDFQKSAAESVGISRDMAKHIMKDFRAYLAENPGESERFVKSLKYGM